MQKMHHPFAWPMALLIGLEGRYRARSVYIRNPCPGKTRLKDAMPANPAGATFIAAPMGDMTNFVCIAMKGTDCQMTWGIKCLKQ